MNIHIHIKKKNKTFPTLFITVSSILSHRIFQNLPVESSINLHEAQIPGDTICGSIMNPWMPK